MKYQIESHQIWTNLANILGKLRESNTWAQSQEVEFLESLITDVQDPDLVDLARQTVMRPAESALSCVAVGGCFPRRGTRTPDPLPPYDSLGFLRQVSEHSGRSDCPATECWSAIADADDRIARCRQYEAQQSLANAR